MSNARNLARLLPNASGQLPDAAMASGSVLQVVDFATSTQTGTTSASWVDTGLSGSITPMSATSKIVILVTSSILSDSTATELNLKLVRNGSVDMTAAYKMTSSAGSIWGNVGMTVVDVPNSTSAVTYKVQIMRVNGTGTVYFGTGGTPAVPRMILMEIAA